MAFYILFIYTSLWRVQKCKPDFLKLANIFKISISVISYYKLSKTKPLNAR